VLKAGNVVRLTASGKDGRPGVVLDVTPEGKAYVALGSKQAANPGVEFEVVKPGQPAYMGMGLQYQTWFAADHFDDDVDASDPSIEVVKIFTPKGVYNKLRKFHGFG
jgi:hypothetical protein